jgi:spore coat polysaccharide biosynthesis protein SpsF
MAAVMVQADLAIASFGMTAYELACMGVPALYFCLTADHAESCQALVEAGMAVILEKRSSIGNIADEIRLLLRDGKYRQRMKANSQKVMNTNGVQRIGAEINKILLTG